MNSYEKGRRWGYAVFRQQVKDNGKTGIRICDKSALTCGKIAQKGKRNGKTLSPEQRSFYTGAVKGFQDFYNKLLKNNN